MSKKLKAILDKEMAKDGAGLPLDHDYGPAGPPHDGNKLGTSRKTMSAAYPVPDFIFNPPPPPPVGENASGGARNAIEDDMSDAGPADVSQTVPVDEEQ